MIEHTYIIDSVLLIKLHSNKWPVNSVKFLIFFLILLFQVEGFDDLSPNECIILVETSTCFLGIKNLIRLDWF